ncbi:hypothetical protein HD554DRAFT_2137357 [Boletus coccyginus]|nr:hypothetical protein HD554DRAFT_2137357 [Boletus coccyginus]
MDDESLEGYYGSETKSDLPPSVLDAKEDVDGVTFQSDLNSFLPMAAPDILSNRLQEELHQYVFNELPAHLMHLQSTQLCDRQTVLERSLPIFRALTAQDIPEGLEASLLNPMPSFADITNIHNFIRKKLGYAVLSDEWGNPEPAYGDIPRPAVTEDRPGHYNVAKFCDIVRGYDMEYAWVDSCCIDKSSDAELNRSICLMYRWYANSSICVAHLADSIVIEDLSRDTWFKRGWTLMQLLAPERLKFYNKMWCPLTDHLNDKQSPEIMAAVERATSISPLEFQRFDPKSLDTYQLSKRMRWAANRSTLLAEDRAYSLMGIFGVTIDVAYEEGGSRAFSRLFKEIVHLSNSPEVVNWIGKPATGLSLRSLGYPSSPDAFIGSNDAVGLFREEPISLAANGLSIKLLMLPATLVAWESPLIAFMKCFRVESRVHCLPDFKPGSPGEGRDLEYALGGWNFSTMDGECTHSGNMIEAILLYRVTNRSKRYQGVWSRIPTQSFVRLDLEAVVLPSGKRWEDYLQTVVL